MLSGARPSPLSTPFICLRCLTRSRSSLRPAGSPRRNLSSATTTTSPLAVNGLAPLPHRRLISLSGPDAPRFLNGLITQAIDESTTAPTYAAFLNAQGRVLADTFIYPTAGFKPYTDWLGHTNPTATDWSCLIEVDHRLLSPIYAHLRRHKLRSRLQLRLVEPEEWSLYAGWDDDASSTELPTIATTHLSTLDPRTPHFGQRLLLPPSSNTPSLPLPLLPASAYHVRRYAHGIPEGPVELPPAAALPLESNMDLMRAIHFRKGCYVGQELTIRTRHTGVVRKRILPAVLAGRDGRGSLDNDSGAGDAGMEVDVDAAAIPSGAAVTHMAREQAEGAARTPRPRAPGKWLAGMGDRGLVLARLDVVRKAREGGTGLEVVWQEGVEKEKGGDGDEGGVEAAVEGGEQCKVGIDIFTPPWHEERWLELEAERGRARMDRAGEAEGETEAEQAEQEEPGEWSGEGKPW